MGLSNSMVSLRIIIALGLFFLVNGAQEPLLRNWNCTSSPKCTESFDGRGVCVDMLRVDIKTLKQGYQQNAGSVEDVCNENFAQNPNDDCCRCLKSKCKQKSSCTDTFREYKAQCFKEGTQPSHYIKYGDGKTCQGKKKCFCYGQQMPTTSTSTTTETSTSGCPQNEKCKNEGGVCTKEPTPSMWPVQNVKCEDEDAGCRCHCNDRDEQCGPNFGGVCRRSLNPLDRPIDRGENSCSGDPNTPCQCRCNPTMECEKRGGSCRPRTDFNEQPIAEGLCFGGDGGLGRCECFLELA